MKENKNFKLKSICHSCVSENPAENKALHTAGSSGRANACPRMTESGRSMVEMLGVLAVIGVLSVAGIAGYTTAMNKYRANELLNEASKRAAIVAMQIASGKTGEGLSVDEFTQPSEYLFGVDKTYASGGKTFKLTLSKDPNGNIDESICNQMIAATGSNSAMQLNNDCSEITFNADLSKGETNTEPELGLKQNVPCGSGFCYEGQTCVDAYFDSYENRLTCDGNWADETGKCCESKDNASCPPGEFFSENGPYRTCMSCPESGFVAEDNGTLACCQRGTGKFLNGYGNWEDPYPSFSMCCTEQGGSFVADENNGIRMCCKGEGYDLKGRVNVLCCENSSIFAKKTDGKFYLLYASSEFPCSDGDSGCVDPSEYTEWHCCNYWDSNSEYDTNKDFCDELRLNGYVE